MKFIFRRRLKPISQLKIHYMTQGYKSRVSAPVIGASLSCTTYSNGLLQRKKQCRLGKVRFLHEMSSHSYLT